MNEDNTDIKLFSIQDKEIQEFLTKFLDCIEILEDLNCCWEWKKGKDKDGYGITCFLGLVKKAHRISYWIFKELCQSWLLRESRIIIRHSCDNTGCVNPIHLLKGTIKENAMDSIMRGGHFNKTKEFCKYGHEFTKENTYIRPDGNRRCKICMSKYTRRNRTTSSDFIGMFKNEKEKN